jgi:hypothetical protein
MNEFLKKLPINWELIGNPANWLVVFLMIAIAGVGLAVIVPFNPDTTTDGE